MFICQSTEYIVNFINKYQLQTIFLQALGGISTTRLQRTHSVSAVFLLYSPQRYDSGHPPRKNHYNINNNNIIELQEIMYNESNSENLLLDALLQILY